MMKFTSLPYFVQLAVYTVLIAVSAKIGMLLSPSDLLFWSPAGLSIVMVTVSGIRFLPAVLFGTAAVYLPEFHSLRTGIVLAAGATVEAFVGYLLLHATDFEPQLKTFRDLLLLIFAGGAVTTGINALISVGAIILLQELPAEQFIPSVLQWWSGNLAAVIVVAPLFFVLLKRNPRSYSLQGIAELLTMIVAVHCTSRFVFHESGGLNGMGFFSRVCHVPVRCVGGSPIRNDRCCRDNVCHRHECRDVGARLGDPFRNVLRRV